VFSGTWTVADASAEWSRDPGGRTVGAEGPTLAALELDRPAGDADEAEDARAQVRLLDGFLDGWALARMPAFSEEGRAVLHDLGILPVYRAQVLLAKARTALMDGRPHQAAAFARMGLDLARPREIGPTNPAGLHVVLATALLETGRSREALDTLQVLAEAMPALEAIDSIVEDLVVLEGMGRVGDSKEN
jgi:hypothetical protein